MMFLPDEPSKSCTHRGEPLLLLLQANHISDRVVGKRRCAEKGGGKKGQAIYQKVANTKIKTGRNKKQSRNFFRNFITARVQLDEAR